MALRTHNPVIAGLSCSGASNILGQDMNLVDAKQCFPSRGQQHVAPEVDLSECTLHLSPQCVYRRARSGFETQRRYHQKSKTGKPVAGKIRYVSMSDENTF